MDWIYHISRKDDWDTAVAAAVYSADTLASEGFIHCSTIRQLLLPANEIFHGQTGLLILCIDSARVKAPIIYEDCANTGQKFPHIYGPLNVDAVRDTIPLPPNADGTFVLPPALQT